MTSAAPYASTSLADLLPALRYADPHLLAARLEDVRLPLGWWHATPLMEVERVIGAEALSHQVAQALRSLWPHAELGDVIPVLRLLGTPGVEPGRTVAQVAREAGPGVVDGDRVLAVAFASILDRLHRRGVPRLESEGARVRDAVSAIARWLPADAPAEVRAALAVLQGVEEEPEDGPSPVSVPEPVEEQVAEDQPAAVELPAPREAFEDQDQDQDPAEDDEEPHVDDASSPSPAPAPVLMDKPLAAFARLVGGWDERALVIAGQRTFTDEPMKLQDLGERFSVSRERVRQLERTVMGSVRRWLSADEDGRAFAGHLAAVAEQLGTVGQVAEVHALHPDHARTVEAMGIPLGDIVARLLPGGTLVGTWIVQGDAAALRAVMQEDLLAACGDTPLAWDDAVALGLRYGVRGEVLADWAADLGRFQVRDGRLLYWGRSLNDRAAAVLALHGTPMSMEDIHEQLADGTAINSMRNQIWTDERFIRLDRNLYGLRAWGGEEYLGIREMIAREITNAGGEAEVNAIAEAISSRFDVSAASVRTNLGGPGFARTRRGWVRVVDETGEQDAPYVPRNDVAGTRRCFVGADGRWWYRMEVTGDHLRGSGFPVPAGWAAHIGGAPHREPVQLRHEVGETSLSWRAQPTLGSVKPLLEHVGATVGDQVFLNVTDGHLNALRLPAPPDGLSPETGAARLTGWTAAVTPAEAVEVIARRIGMEPGQDRAALLERLAERGDKDIAELLEQALSGAVPAF
ncbi:sigma factor-like helix-turn-helix DNA-binding protein [Streptomyces sp. NPDC087297]|uniref:sigma factor-like helix-turn-helix DNA-binding protein n=1 Tax=Streptomyces sp. NPDC087297 TaxID=3365778 RepID=UPI0037FE5C55